jgi:hypothetical protein
VFVGVGRGIVAREEAPAARDDLVAKQRRRVVQNDEVDVVAVQFLDGDCTHAQLVPEGDRCVEKHGEIDVAARVRLPGRRGTEQIDRFDARIIAQALANGLEIGHAAIIALLPIPAEGAIEIGQRNQAVTASLGGGGFGGEELLLGVEDFEVGGEAGLVP